MTLFPQFYNLGVLILHPVSKSQKAILKMFRNILNNLFLITENKLGDGNKNCSGRDDD